MWKKIRENYRSYLLIVFGITLYVGLNFIAQQFNVIAEILSVLWRLILPFLVGFGFAFLLVKPMHFIEKYLIKIIKNTKFARVMAVLITLIGTLALIVGLGVLIVPQLIQSILNLEPTILQLTSRLSQLTNFLKETYEIDIVSIFSLSNYKQILETIKSSGINVVGVVNIGLSMSASTLKMILNLLISIICAMYILLDKEKFLRYVKKCNYALFDKKRADVNYEITLLARDIFNNFIIGKIIDSVIIGILCYIGMLIFKFEYPLLISFFVGVTNVIPVFGPFIGGIPGVIILFIINPIMGLWFAVFIFALQQFDGNILGPYILGDKLGLPSLGILVSVVIGGGLFGFIGMLLGVPVFALFFELSKRKLNKKLEEKEIEI